MSTPAETLDTKFAALAETQAAQDRAHKEQAAELSELRAIVEMHHQPKLNEHADALHMHGQTLEAHGLRLNGVDALRLDFGRLESVLTYATVNMQRTSAQQDRVLQKVEGLLNELPEHITETRKHLISIEERLKPSAN